MSPYERAMCEVSGFVRKRVLSSSRRCLPEVAAAHRLAVQGSGLNGKALAAKLGVKTETAYGYSLGLAPSSWAIMWRLCWLAGLGEEEAVVLWARCSIPREIDRLRSVLVAGCRSPTRPARGQWPEGTWDAWKRVVEEEFGGQPRTDARWRAVERAMLDAAAERGAALQPCDVRATRRGCRKDVPPGTSRQETKVAVAAVLDAKAEALAWEERFAPVAEDDD